MQQKCENTKTEKNNLRNCGDPTVDIRMTVNFNGIFYISLILDTKINKKVQKTHHCLEAVLPSKMREIDNWHLLPLEVVWYNYKWGIN